MGQTQFIAHYLFESRLRDLKPRSLARSELDAMILLLEARMTLWRAEQQSSATVSQSSSSSSGGGGGNAPVAPFRFLRGRSPHRLFNLADEPLRAGHHPLVFYAAMAGISQIAYLALYLAGFRYYAGSGTVSFFSFFSLASPPHHHRRGFAHSHISLLTTVALPAPVHARLDKVARSGARSRRGRSDGRPSTRRAGRVLVQTCVAASAGGRRQAGASKGFSLAMNQVSRQKRSVRMADTVPGARAPARHLPWH